MQWSQVREYCDHLQNPYSFGYTLSYYSWLYNNRVFQSGLIKKQLHAGTGWGCSVSSLTFLRVHWKKRLTHHKDPEMNSSLQSQSLMCKKDKFYRLFLYIIKQICQRRVAHQKWSHTDICNGTHFFLVARYQPDSGSRGDVLAF